MRAPSCRHSLTGVSPTLWLTSDWNDLSHPVDTTVRLMQECLRLGIATYASNFQNLFCDTKDVRIRCRELLGIGPTRELQTCEWGSVTNVPVTSFEFVHCRVDPPVNLGYIQHLQLLHHGICHQGVNKCSTTVVNPINILVSHNSKFLSICPSFTPLPSCVSSRWEELLAFGRREWITVAKPPHKMNGKDVELISWTSSLRIRRAKKVLSSLTQDFTQPVMLQKFVRTKDETRFWFVNGDLLCAVRRIRKSIDFDASSDSELAVAKLNRAESSLVTTIGKVLARLSVSLAAVDVICNSVIDVNITSPGLLVESEELIGKNLARQVIEKVQDRI
jgi:glutathione synthase